MTNIFPKTSVAICRIQPEREQEHDLMIVTSQSDGDSNRELKHPEDFINEPSMYVEVQLIVLTWKCLRRRDVWRRP